MFPAETALLWTQKLAAFSIGLQTIEYLKMQRTIAVDQIWTSDILNQDFQSFPRFLQRALLWMFQKSNFKKLLLIQLGLSLLCFFFLNPYLFSLLFLSNVLVALRWRGVFNGGSDSMTSLTLLALTVAVVFRQSPMMVSACLWYLGIQVTLSYFLAGLVKIKNPSWRSGRALFEILKYKKFPPQMSLISSWLVMGFECSFPLIFIRPEAAPLMLGIGFVFHLVNVYFFGLNRFLWAWLAAYPSLYYCIFYFR